MFDRRSQFDRSFFDRTRSFGPPLPARIAGKYTVETRTSDPFTVTTRCGIFTVVATK